MEDSDKLEEYPRKQPKISKELEKSLDMKEESKDGSRL